MSTWKRSAGSADPPAALLISPEAPYPTAGGGAIRTASLLEYLAARYRLDAVFFRQPGAADPSAAVPPGLLHRSCVIRLPFHSRSGWARAGRNLVRFLRGVPPLWDRFSGFQSEMADFVNGRRYAVTVVEHFWCAAYLEILRPVGGRIVLDLHNVESVLHQTSAGASGWPVSALHRRFAGAYLALERRWLPRFDLLLATSEADAARISAIACGASCEVYPNALPPRTLPNRPQGESLIFSGNLDYHPNRAAAGFFFREIWPELRRRRPQLRWILLGKSPEAVAGMVDADPRILLTGAVDDALPHLAAATVAVAPLLSGSGTRVKILEAWAAGVPVVSTRIGAEGLPVRDGEHLLLADRPDEFAAAVVSLLESEPLRRRLSEAARRLLEERFTWPAAWTVLERLGI